MTRRTVEHATCLGCGCACDDIAVVVDGDRIAEARNSCALGRAWFADGSVPRETRSSEKTVAPDVALADAAKLLGRAERPLVYLAPERRWARSASGPTSWCFGEWTRRTATPAMPAAMRSTPPGSRRRMAGTAATSSLWTWDPRAAPPTPTNAWRLPPRTRSMRWRSCAPWCWAG